MNRLPIVEEISAPFGAADVFTLFHKEPFAFFLDSGMDPAKLGRYSFIGSDPFLVLKSRGDTLTLLVAGREEKRKTTNPFRDLGRLLGEYELEASGFPVPLVGGGVGYFSYDLCHFIEKVPSTAVDDLQLPECCLGFYDVVVAFDHLTHRTYIASTGFPELDEGRRIKRARERLQQIKARIVNGRVDPHHRQTHPVENGRTSPDDFSGAITRSNFTQQQYIRAVEIAREYIASGEIYQVNLSQRFEGNLTTHPYSLYQTLRRINPAPFAAYLNFDEVTVLSASPERFLKLEGDRVETRPMKGTRPRGRSSAEDEAIVRELLSSEKDRAENVMIVDLERNDLGKVCHFGTVNVIELFTVEKYATVFQLTSCVEGRLRENKNRIDLLEACFPGGSITGAPKIRAMEIIDELEPTRRSIYTGSIGYLSFSGQMDLNIVIRTILARKDRVYFQVGGGIVYDSRPEGEYQETLHKAKALFQALNMSLLVSTKT